MERAEDFKLSDQFEEFSCEKQIRLLMEASHYIYYCLVVEFQTECGQGMMIVGETKQKFDLRRTGDWLPSRQSALYRHNCLICKTNFDESVKAHIMKYHLEK